MENINIDAVIYGFIINSFILLIILIIDVIKYRLKYKALKKAKDILPIVEEDNFINTNEIEELYKSIIFIQKKIYNEQEASQLTIRNEMLDFYTLWIHQIKTPIFALKLLTKESEDISIKSEIIKIEQYINMVLNYIKLSDKTTELSIKTHSVKKIVNEVLKSFSSVFIAKKLKVNIDIEDIEVATDSKWLEFALSQIISNAIKYTNEGEIKISLADYKCVISDTGIGMNEEDVKRAFDKGFTGKIGRNDKNATGIGLYLAKKSLNLIGCSVEIQSKIGYGTSVTIDLSQNTNIYD